MTTPRGSCGLALALLLGWSAVGHAQPAPVPPADPYRALAPRVRATLRFATDLALVPGAPPMRVRVYSWHVAPQQDVASFPLEGAATVEVRAGEVEATVDGKTAAHREGDHFVVPEGSRLRIKTGNDSVSLHGVVVIRR
jgi:hypothetical protein